MRFHESLVTCAKLVFRKLGFRLLREDRLPRGVDHIVDLRELEGGFEPGVIFDVGANIGVTVQGYKSRFPKASIYAFEPAPEAAEALRRRFATNRQVRIRNMAIGHYSGIASLELRSPTSERNQVVSRTPEIEQGSAVKVEMRTLDSIITDYEVDTVDLIKIDVEGYEIQVLRGAQSSLKERRIKAVYAECSFDRRDEQHSAFTEIHNYLAMNSFDFLGLYEVHHHERKLNYCNGLWVLRSEKRSKLTHT